jgi:hypothetical protein
MVGIRYDEARRSCVRVLLLYPFRCIGGAPFHGGLRYAMAATYFYLL